MFRSLRGLLLCTPFVLSACADDGACTIASVGDLNVLNTQGSPIVKATLNGHPVALIVDTGAVITSIWPQQIDRLGLEASSRQVHLRGVGGETTGTIVTAHTLGLGSATASDVSFVSVGTLLDGHMIGDRPIVGLLGADFLSNYDVVFDLPNHRVNLYDVHGCKGAIPHWTGAYYKVPINHDGWDQTKIIVHVTLNGHGMDAILDSGAHRTLISTDDAAAAGVRTSDLTGDRKGVGYGIDDEKGTRFLHRFDSLELGPFRFSNPVLTVGQTDHSLLGAEFFRRHRVWIPRARDALFVQPVAPFYREVTPPPPPGGHDATSGRNKPE
ncbi:aspartyl protease family protein [Gluconacetobacter takamatsuzukensis]|uniref:Peptidase A2 domain-containing protein n=1 Tax=Gluconacetobacter takamatsuzukensis TaxID=1286190 RepID=A0A7W4KAT4_9PROT|nr:aspartyl protease family protein [Gluconacetobacter takamatsuzukensis]MBB2203523.1 hypothetical protein [Gluconacetobacter takamatsuzukensis]